MMYITHRMLMAKLDEAASTEDTAMADAIVLCFLQMPGAIERCEEMIYNRRLQADALDWHLRDWTVPMTVLTQDDELEVRSIICMLEEALRGIAIDSDDILDILKSRRDQLAEQEQ